MFRHILVPLDGSERAERALPVAARIARATQGTLIVVQISSVDHMPFALPEMASSESVVQAELHTALQYLTQVTTPFEQEGIAIEKVAAFGMTIPLLLSTLESYHADLVVMCSHGRTGFLRWALGSIAEGIADASPVPVLILREHGPVPGGLHPDPTLPLRILVPLDGSRTAKMVLEPAADLITALSAPHPGALHLLKIVQPLDTTHEDSLSILMYRIERAKHSLHQLTENIRAGFEIPSLKHVKLDITSSVARDRDVAHAILRVAENGEDAEGCGVFGGCDVIAIATHGRTGIDYLIQGSITKRVLHATKLPLLIVRPQPTQEQKKEDIRSQVTRDHANQTTFQSV